MLNVRLTHPLQTFFLYELGYPREPRSHIFGHCLDF
jgi:hypothetical protein